MLAAWPFALPPALHPTSSSWLNLVEQWFVELTSKWLTPGTHRTADASRQPYVATILGVAGAGMLVAGIWAGIALRSFARLVAFPYHEHSLHDLGAFQVGVGATLLLALVWRDAPRSL